MSDPLDPQEPEFKLAPDLWEEEEHRSLDQDLNNRWKTPHAVYLGRVARLIIAQVEAKTPVISIGDDHAFLELCHAHPGLWEMILSAWSKGSFKDVRNLAILRGAPLLEAGKEEQEDATVKSYSLQFEGLADHTLFLTIKSYLNLSHNCGDQAGSPYANFTLIINSSGTGKSRMVDELGRKYCFVVPMCLRKSPYGYPPPDCELRNWLLAPRPYTKDLDKAAIAFLRALFEVALKRIQATKGGNPSASSTVFAELMNQRVTFKSHSKYRAEFYTEVVMLAKEYEKTTTTQHIDSDITVKNVAKLLLAECGSDIVVLSFDESHELAEPPLNRVRAGPGEPEGNWTIYSQIRKAFRSVLGLNIFALFLTTTGKYRTLYPEPRNETSNRIVDDRSKFPPITETGFNQLVRAVQAPVSLASVASLDYVCSLGRPLWGSRYEKGSALVRKDILDFAREKLLPNGSGKRDIGTLACLSVRFAIDIRPSNRGQENTVRELVEAHLRYCIKADSDLRMITVAPSEPLLAEAAFEQLYYHYEPSLDPFLQVLAQNLDKWGVHRGDRGELVMSLIWMTARDLLVRRRAPKISSRRPWNPLMHSVISVQDFIEQLLPPSFHAKLKAMPPSAGGDDTPFPEAFKECRIWCNHFIQVQDYKVINTKYLCALLSSGIGVLCAPNQAGIDMIWIGLKDDEIREENLVLILGQAKNDKRYRAKSDPVVVDDMDPIKLGICQSGRTVPIIRIVFALASQTPGVTLLEKPPRKIERFANAPFISYDFWFAGVGQSTFGCVEPSEVKYYEDILTTSRLMYEVDDPVHCNLLSAENRATLEAEMEIVASRRLELRREANSMRMADEPHFPEPWRQRLFPSTHAEEDVLMDDGTAESGQS